MCGKRLTRDHLLHRRDEEDDDEDEDEDDRAELVAVQKINFAARSRRWRASAAFSTDIAETSLRQ